MNSLRSIFHSISKSFVGANLAPSLRTQTRSLHSKINPQTVSGKSLLFWKWTKHAGIGLASTIATLALSGALYQEICTKIDAKRYPPIGELVDVGGYTMHLYTIGTGGPSVILDAGLGCNALGWSLVQPEIAKFAKVTSFDRPGNGWSEESPLERTSQNIAMELHKALQKAIIRGPYIFVGHSFGGINARVFANLYPDEVLGIVLPESSHEEQLKEVPMPQINHTLTMLAYRLGVARLMTHTPPYKKSVAVFPEQVQNQLLSQLCTTKFIRTVLQESAHFKTSCGQLKALGGSLGDKPLTVISAVKKVSAEGSGLTQEQIDALHISFQRLQKDLVTKSSQGKQVFATESDHMIPYNQPQIIVDSVREIIDLYRKNSLEA